LTDFDIIAREVSGYRTRFEAIEKRPEEVERVNARLEDAALTTARSLQEISGQWNAVYEAMRRKTSPNWPLRSDGQGQALTTPHAARRKSVSFAGGVGDWRTRRGRP
jgi:hypothetical protein